MAAGDTFRCSVITPERKVLECDARFVAFPAHDGEMGVLPLRAPLVCKLGIGLLRVETGNPSRDREGADRIPSRDHDGPGGAAEHVLFIDGGFAEVADNRLTILTPRARKAEEIDAGQTEQSLIEARAMSITDEASFDARANALQRARIQLKIAQPGR